MSLILEALKKAEQDRQVGQAPVLDEMLVRNRPVIVRRRNQQQEVALTAGLIVSALFVLAGLAYWLWPTSAPPEAVPVTAAPAPPVAAALQAPAAPLRIDPERLEAPVADAPETGVDLSDTGASEAMTMDELDAETPAPNQPASAAVQTLQPPVPAIIETPAAVAATTQSPASRPDPSAVRPLKEMPPNFRAEFPRLILDIHVYDDNPLRRFALINGKKYRETDTLLDGPRVAEIRPEGVVLEHRGSKVLLELPR